MIRSALAGLGLLATSLPAVETAGELLISLDARDFETGTAVWPQRVEDVGIAGDFEAHGSPARLTVAGTEAVVFDGDGDHFRGPATTSALHAPGAPHSVEVWVYQGDIRDQESVVSWGRRSGPEGTFAGFRYAAHPEFGAIARWGIVKDQGFDTLPAPGAWHHLAFTYDGNVQRVYVDGELDGEREVGRVSPHRGMPVMIGAELLGNLKLEGSFVHFSGALAHLRIHRGALDADQVRRNFQAERAGFPGVSARPPRRGPVHRFALDQAAGEAAHDTPLADSIGGLRGAIRGHNARFTGTGVRLGGGSSTRGAYLDLPNGLISAHRAVSIEFWAAQTAASDWSRLFSIGTGTAGEITGPGGEFDGGEILALFSSVGNLPVYRLSRTDARRPNGDSDRETSPYPETDLGRTFHHVVTYDPDTAHWRWYRDGVLMETLPDLDGPPKLDDVNVWFGKSGSSDDHTFPGIFEEIRIYNYALGGAEIHGSFLAGPDAPLPEDARFTWRPETDGPTTGSGDSPAREMLDAAHWEGPEDRRSPGRPGDTATIPRDGAGRLTLEADASLALGALNLARPGGVRLRGGDSAALSLDTGRDAPATLALAPDAGESHVELPLRLASDTEFINHSPRPLALDGPVSGSGVLVKSGSGPVHCHGVMDGHHAPIRVVGGDLILSDRSAATLNHRRLELSRPGRLVLASGIPVTAGPDVHGDGWLVHRGAGPLTLDPDTRLAGPGILELREGAGRTVHRGRIDGAESLFLDNEAVFAAGSSTRLLGWLSIGNRAAGHLRIEKGAEVEIGQAGHLNIGDTGQGHSSLVMEGGTVRMSELHIGKHPGASGLLAQHGGRLENRGGDSHIGGSRPEAGDCWGAWHLEGGSFTTDGSLFIGSHGNGTMRVRGGRATIDGHLTVGRFRSASGEPSHGLLDIGAGSVRVGTGDHMLAIGEEGHGVVNVHGSGELICQRAIVGGGSPEAPGNGTLNLLEGGRMTAASLSQVNRSAAAGELHFDGGTLRAREDHRAFISGLDAVRVGRGGATIDTRGFEVTVRSSIEPVAGVGVESIPVLSGGARLAAAPLVHLHGGEGRGATARARIADGAVESVEITSPGSGFHTAPEVLALGGAGEAPVLGRPELTTLRGGGLRKTGSGRLRLDASCTLDGPLDVAAGTLSVNAECATGGHPVRVEDGATITGAGVLHGAVDIAPKARLAAGSGSGGLRVSGDVVLRGRLDFEGDPVRIDGGLRLLDAALTLPPADVLATRRVWILAEYESLEGRFKEVENLANGGKLHYAYQDRPQIALVFPADGPDE